MGDTNLVDLEGVSKTFRLDRGEVHALQNIDLAVADGEFVSLVGPSGCGKSTLLNIVGGLLAPTAGRVAVAGHTVTGPPEEVGMMFQSSVLLEWRTARANVLLPIEIAHGRRAAREHRERADALLDFAGLGGFEENYPRQLSGGMQQRVAICRMLIADPTLLLMDEPFGALDEFNREYMNVELSRIVTSAGKCAMFVTHDIQEAVFLADRVCVMSPRPGRIVGIVEVDLPKPRTLDLFSNSDFEAYTKEVRGHLQHGVDAAART